MYAEPSLIMPFLEGFSLLPSSPAPITVLQEHQLSMSFAGDFGGVSTPMVNIAQPSTIFEYDLGAEGDLFKAPEQTILEEALFAIDPISNASMQAIPNDHLLSDVFYDCEKDLLEKYAVGEPFCGPSAAVQIPVLASGVALSEDYTRAISVGPLNKSLSAGSLSSAPECLDNGAAGPNFFEFKDLDFDLSCGMRRAFSEGDIQKLGNSTAGFGNTNPVHYSLEQLVAMGDFKSEDRRQKLSRYMKKKTRRNFGRTIKYACRKALADCQPRVRGRFAKTEEYEISKQQKLRMIGPNSQ